MLSNLSFFLAQAVVSGTNTIVSSGDASGAAAMTDRGELMVNTTITGLVVVFSVLIILTLLFACYGKIVDKINGVSVKKKKAPKAAKPAAPAPKPQASVLAAKAAAPAASADGSIPEEIVAVIAAAVAAMSDGDTSYRISGIRRAPRQGASAWRQAALAENTRRF